MTRPLLWLVLALAVSAAAGRDLKQASATANPSGTQSSVTSSQGLPSTTAATTAAEAAAAATGPGATAAAEAAAAAAAAGTTPTPSAAAAAAQAAAQAAAAGTGASSAAANAAANVAAAGGAASAQAASQAAAAGGAASEIPVCEGDVLKNCCPLPIQFDQSGKLATVCKFQVEVPKSKPFWWSWFHSDKGAATEVVEKTWTLCSYPPPVYTDGTVRSLCAVTRVSSLTGAPC
ncbi:hypothetical protein ABPG75_007518 [Micractinium tetrahymenae]